MLVKGETIQQTVEHVRLFSDERKPVGQLWVTNFRLIFREEEGGSVYNELRMPISQIGGVAKGRSNKTSLRVYCKNLITLHFSFSTAQDAKLIQKALGSSAGTNTVRGRKSVSPLPPTCFAVASKQEFPEHKDGWKIYSPTQEFCRQGVLKEDGSPKGGWRLSTLNRNYKLAPEYPGSSVVPEALDDADLLEAASHHVGCALPVLVWQHAGNQAAVCRCQRKHHPDKVSYNDDKVVLAIADANPTRQPVRVFKTFSTSLGKRSTTSGRITSRSASSSSASSSSSSSLVVGLPVDKQRAHTLNLLVDGVKRVEEIRNRLREACAIRGGGDTLQNSIMDDSATGLWLQSVKRALRAADSLVDTIETKASILLESDDVTDHTHVLSLFLLLVDPYFRTLVGFQVLIEKEWLAFAHPFLQSKKLSNSSNKNLLLGDEVSPIFLQFLDGVWQLMQLFPRAFEFNERLLTSILEALYSNQFGTFLFESERERVEYDVANSTNSVWSPINFDCSRFLNPFYRVSKRLKLPTNPSCLLWASYYLSWPQRSLVERAGEVLRASSDPKTRLLSLQKVGLSYLPLVGQVKARYAWEDIKMAKNYLSVLPLQVMQSHRLRRLDLADNRFTSFSPQLLHLLGRRCPRLSLLSLRGNRIEELPDGLHYLTSLRALDVSRNQISRVSPSLGRMKRLRELNISHNQLSDLPEQIENIKTLRMLDLSHNPVNALPTGLLQLRRLTSLNLSSLGLSELPEEFRQLVSLSTLILDHNLIKEIPMSLCILGTLKKLSLQHNNITALPLEIANLVNLHELNVSNNQLASLSSGLGNLVNLRSLSLQKNNLKHLPSNFGFLQKLTRIKLDDNPWKTPPREVVSGGLESVMQFMKDLLAGADPCFRMKLMIVGQENVGKTSLLRCLTRKKNAKGKLDLETMSTDGIDIESWEFTTTIAGQKQEVTLSAWDFAGQEIYYTTHQFFLSARSLYVVVFNLMEGDVASRVPFWLQSIRSRAGEQVPIVLVGTHVDEYMNGTSQYSRERIIMDLHDKYARHFHNIESIHLVSCVTQKGMDGLRAEIERLVAAQPHMGEEFPTSYLELEKLAMTEKKRMPPIVTAQDFAAMGIICNIREEAELNSATALLHNLGSLVHFDTDGLRDLIILDPQWLSDMMSTIITTKHSFVSDGILNHTALRQIWRPPKFPRELHRTLLKLLQKFQIIYVLPGVVEDPEDDPWVTGSSFVPCLLPPGRPHQRVQAEFPQEAPNGETTLGRNYVFDFVPTGLFSRLLVKLLHVAPRPAVLWRNGIIFRRGSEQIFIELQDARKTILIRLRGNETDNLRIVVETLESLTQDFFQIEPEIYVPCVHCMEDNPLEPFMFPLSVCENAAISGKPFVLCNGQRPIRVDTLVPDIAMSEVASALLDFGELRRDRRIGKGGYSVVYQGRYRDEVVAIKRIKLPPGQAETEDTRREAFRQFRREVWLMSGLDHPNIVSLKGFCITPICLVTEYLPYGNLYDYLHDSKRKVTWPFRLRVAMDVAKGCAFLHATKPAIIHRDLKSPNILLASVSPHAPVVAKVTDFGVSQILAPTTVGRAVACPVWLAPEVIKNEEYSEKADVYSFGVMLWELLSRREFFGEIEFLSELQEAILDGKRPALPEDCLPSFANLVRACWAGQADQRPSFPEIIDLLSVIMEKQNIKASCDLWGADLNNDTLDELSTIDDHADSRSELDDSMHDSQEEEEDDDLEDDDAQDDDDLPAGAAKRVRGAQHEDDDDDDDQDHLPLSDEEDGDSQSGNASSSSETESAAKLARRARSRSTGASSCSASSSSPAALKSKRAANAGRDEDDDEDMMPMVGGEARASPTPDRSGASPGSERRSGAFRAVGSVIGGRPQHPAVALLQGKTSPSGTRRRRHSWVYDGARKKTDEESDSTPKYSLVAGEEDEFHDPAEEGHTEDADAALGGDAQGSVAQLSFASASPLLGSRRARPQRNGVLGSGEQSAVAAEAQAAANLSEGLAAQSEGEVNALALTQPSEKTRDHRSAFQRHLAAPLESSVNALLQVGSGSLWAGCSDGTISVLDVDSGEVLGTHHAHFDRIFAMVNVDDHTVWSSSKDGTVRVWSSRHPFPKLKQKIRLKGMLAPCLLAVDRQTVWAGTSNGRLLIFETRTGKLRKQVKLDVPVVQCMVLAPDMVWVGADRMILRVDPNSYKVHGFVQGHKRVVHSMVVCGDTVWSCSSDKSIRVWDQRTAECLNVLEGHTGRVFTLLAEGDQYVWSAGWDTSLIVWNAQTRVFATEHRESHSDAVSALCMVRGRSLTTRVPRICAASWDKLISMWSMHTPPDVWARLEWVGATESGRSTARITTPKRARTRIPLSLRGKPRSGDSSRSSSSSLSQSISTAATDSSASIGDLPPAAAEAEAEHTEESTTDENQSNSIGEVSSFSSSASPEETTSVAATL
eukprot:CAMPEP_0174232408 /NCGR_PEP_ID=MMETSP0417-20130205/2700_1 /TAXON_ID=242541 /ORGANISM="Mayorella sp, Strain BSH-02190019" /LENGTH=2427 /DNA_ID=CAMNT_0015310457 /DNA_START=88 /DNA_END=7371 /DNA_ORIENTATION=+